MTENKSPQQRIILASTSRYRTALFKRLALSFETCDPGVNESRQQNETPEALVARLASAKAASVHEKIQTDALIIGCDQVAVVEGRVLGKPGGLDAAIEQLRYCSGRPVHFLTSLCLRNTWNGQERVVTEKFTVYFRQLGEDSIKRYLAKERPFDCAGSFKAEGLGIALFTRMQGDDPTSLVGLPLIRLVELLAEAGIDVP